MRHLNFSPEKATFDAALLSEANVHSSLKSFGCALIKGLLDPARLAMFDERISRNMEGADAVLTVAGAPEGFNAGFPLYFAGRDEKQRIHETLKRSYPFIFKPRAMRGMDCTSLTDYIFSALKETGLGEVIRKYLGMKRLYTSAAICHIRKFEPPVGSIREAQRPLEFHQDNKLYAIRKEILTLWFPFRYEHGRMASLEFLPNGEKKLFATVTEFGIDRDSVAQERFWSPEYELGDAVLISGYSPHRTYYPAGAIKSRTSIDMRFFPLAVPAPIFAEPNILAAAEMAAKRAIYRIATTIKF